MTGPSYHARTHLVGGTDPLTIVTPGIPWAQTNQGGTTLSIPGTNVATYFSVHDTGGTDRFSTSDATIFANTSTTSFTGSAVYGIQINAPGTYMVQGNFFWRSQGTIGRGIVGYYSQSNGSGPSNFQFGRTNALTGDNFDGGAAAAGLPHLSFYEFFSVSSSQLAGVNALYAQVLSGGASTVSAQMFIFQVSTAIGLRF